ncbi:tol-pal system YbgF family protein [Flavobacterium sp. LM5]|jgi:tetratricopeptide (TPR) repeat protein|uniref:tetratricopeptide repeat protein n=1 Tax=Flavobacterium sp. LM5 TaxID=1938610 RepID=UPI0009922D1E|nr:hypothetical protein [Flavobacterium sp. LM5]
MRLRPSQVTVLILIAPMLLCGQNNLVPTIHSDKEIKSKRYEVTETIHSGFGSTKVMYTVSNKNLINTNDLGPNNTREVKEIIVYKKKSRDQESIYKTKEIKEVVLVVDQQVNAVKTISIDPLDTYERMVDQGIRSAGLLSQLADAYFYKNEYTKASQYYLEFFKIGKKIKPEYYFRYAMALKNIGQEKRSKELLATYEALLQSENKK